MLANWRAKEKTSRFKRQDKKKAARKDGLLVETK
jgi:hypothetical protein